MANIDELKHLEYQGKKLEDQKGKKFDYRKYNADYHKATDSYANTRREEIQHDKESAARAAGELAGDMYETAKRKTFTF